MKILSIFWFCFLLAGCTSSQSNPRSFFENVENVHTIGEFIPDGKKIRFVYTPEGMANIEVIVNLEDSNDSISMFFRLCENNGLYEGIIEQERARIESKSVDCNSWLTLTPLLNDKYALSYELNLLIGFKVEVGPEYIPVMKKLAQYGAIYSPGDIAYPLQRYINDAIVEETKVEFLP